MFSSTRPLMEGGGATEKRRHYMQVLTYASFDAYRAGLYRWVLLAVNCPRFRGCVATFGNSVPAEDRLRQECGNDKVRHVDNVGDAQIDGDRADHIGLRAAEAALLQQLYHDE